MFGFLIPKEFGFFDVFDKHAALCVEGSQILLDMLGSFNEAPAKVRRLKETEHKADELTHQTVEMLHTTFVTPIDRDQIHELITDMDDIMDLIDGAARRMLLYGVKEIPSELVDLAKILKQSALEVQKAVGNLRSLKNAKSILASCVEINKLENDGDAIRDAAIAKLFKEEKDAVKVLIWKEIFGDIETAIDKCEDVANIIEGVVLENA